MAGLIHAESIHPFRIPPSLPGERGAGSPSTGGRSASAQDEGQVCMFSSEWFMELPFSLQSLQPLAALEKRWQREKFEEGGCLKYHLHLRTEVTRENRRAALRDCGKLEDHKFIGH